MPPNPCGIQGPTVYTPCSAVGRMLLLEMLFTCDRQVIDGHVERGPLCETSGFLGEP